jgi:DNA-binding MarR family transcriptional regulator
VSALPQPGPRYQALIQLLRTAETLWNASRLFFARWELSPSQFNVLNLLYLNPAGFTQIELSRLLIVHRSNVTGLVDRLEKRQFVRRSEQPGDRRVYRVVLAPKGRRYLERILPHYYLAAEQVWGGLAPLAAQQFVQQLEQISANAEKAAQELPG